MKAKAGKKKKTMTAKEKYQRFMNIKNNGRK
jgi:hypothetical protein